MRFSVIIPLEFHRGVAERCVASWTSGQTFERREFEVIVVAQEGHDDEELGRIGALLGQQDRLLIIGGGNDHDMKLAARAAEVARGDYLVFTEAHCLADGGFLQQSDSVLRDNPQWCGFSGRSVPDTHNLLSEIEAEMYEHDISRNLRTHPWLKVLDQCFVVSSRDYRSVGGIEPEYGHFAEWLLAARLYRAGLVVGYAPGASIRHYYVGDLGELEEFTMDFSKGEMLFACRSSTDPCGDLFAEVPEWYERHAKDPKVSGAMLVVLLKDICSQARSGSLSRSLQRLASWPWGELVFWLRQRCVSAQLTKWGLSVRVGKKRRAVAENLSNARRERAKAEFLEWVDLCAKLARVSSKFPEQDSAGTSFSTEVCNHSEWRAGRWEKLAVAGFFPLERLANKSFRWSRPSAVVQLPRLAGPVCVTIEWAVPRAHEIRFYASGKRVPEECLSHVGDRHTRISLPEGWGARNLSWVSPRLRAKNDSRALGVAVVGVVSRPGQPVDVSEQAGKESESIYFLHVPKCAGTTLRMIFFNSVPASGSLAAFKPEFYYRHQLRSNPEIHAPYKMAAGHFGWDLPSMVERRWRIATMLRHPVSRLVSTHRYLLQTARIPSDIGLGEWFERHLALGDLAASHFVSTDERSEAKGAKALGPLAEAMFSRAVVNLKKCECVGIYEQMEASVDELAWRFGLLPPGRLPTHNPTLVGNSAAVTDPSFNKAVQKYLGSELEFYEVATQLFESRKREIADSLRGEARDSIRQHGMRGHLRRRFFARQAISIGNRLPGKFEWTPEDVFWGAGLHQHEQHGGVCLRWTGAARETVFYGLLPLSGECCMSLHAHPATPEKHLRATKVRVNGAEVSLAAESDGGGVFLRGKFTPESPPSESSPFSEVSIAYPTVRYPGDFRDLGIALTRILVTRG